MGRDLTENQIKVIGSLTTEYESFKHIVKLYGNLRTKSGLTAVYSSDSGSCKSALSSLLKKGLVEYKYKGQWKLKTK